MEGDNIMLKKLKSVKAFAMAELLAVCVAMLAIFSILFSNYLPLVAEYENRISYNDVTSEYAAHYFRKMYISALSDSSLGEARKNTIDSGIGNKGYYIVYSDSKNQVCNQVLQSDKALCNSLLKEYGVESIIITNYQLEDVKKYISDNDTASNDISELKEYIKYLPNYQRYEGRELYRLIVKTKYGYATTGIFSENMGGVKKNLCAFYGPYSSGTKKTSYAYYGDKIYYNLYCTSSNDVESTALNIKDVKSSDERFLNNIKLVSSTAYENSQSGIKGYNFRIEAEAINYNNQSKDVYLYLEDYKVTDKNGIYNSSAKGDSVNVGLLSTNIYNSKKEVLTCDAISSTKEKEMEKILNDRINSVGAGTRQAVVEAARFLAIDFPYVIPYYWTDGIKDYPTTGYYLNKGLYLNDNSGWGCNIEKKALPMGIFEVGGKYPNGLECSGFTTWALINGGFENTGAWYPEIFIESTYSGKTYAYQNTYNPDTHSLGYSNIFDYYMADSNKAKLASDTWLKLDPSSKVCISSSCGLSDYNQIDTYDIKAGDLIWKEGHVGMIIGVTTSNSKKLYAVAEANYTKNSNNIRGLRVVSYYTEQLYNSSVGWTHVVKMDDIYGEGNLTNYDPYW